MEVLNRENAVVNVAGRGVAAPVLVRQDRKKPRTTSDRTAGASKTPVTNPHGGKTELVLKKLRPAKGASIAMLMEATGWQAHSVRGFLSAVIRKKLGLSLVSETGKDGVRRYRIVDGESSGTSKAG